MGVHPFVRWSKFMMRFSPSFSPRSSLDFTNSPHFASYCSAATSRYRQEDRPFAPGGCPSEAPRVAEFPFPLESVHLVWPKLLLFRFLLPIDGLVIPILSLEHVTMKPIIPSKVDHSDKAGGLLQDFSRIASQRFNTAIKHPSFIDDFGHVSILASKNQKLFRRTILNDMGMGQNLLLP